MLISGVCLFIILLHFPPPSHECSFFFPAFSIFKYQIPRSRFITSFDICISALFKKPMPFSDETDIHLFFASFVIFFSVLGDFTKERKKNNLLLKPHANMNQYKLRPLTGKKKSTTIKWRCLVESFCYSYIFREMSSLWFLTSWCSFLFLCISSPSPSCVPQPKLKTKDSRAKGFFYHKTFSPRHYLFFFLTFLSGIIIENKTFLHFCMKHSFYRICVFL